MAVNTGAVVGGVAIVVFLFFALFLYWYCTSRHKQNPKPTHHFVGNNIALGGPGGRQIPNPLPSYGRSNRSQKSDYADLEAQYPTYPSSKGFQEYALPPPGSEQGTPQRLTLPNASPPPQYLPQQPQSAHLSSHVHGSRGPAPGSHHSASMHGSRPSSRAPQSHHSSRAPGSIRSQGPPAPPLPPQGSIYSAQAYSKGGVTQPASERFTPSPYAANGSKVMPPVGGTRSGPGMGGSKVGSAATGASKGSSVGQQLASVGRYLDPCSRK